MVGFVGMGMGMRGNKMLKRKEADVDLDELNHNFSDFSLSSPARKIRRLDAELPPIMEEEDESSEISCSSASSPAFMEESELDTVNDKAIVLFKPLNSPFLNSSSPCNLSVSVDSDLISGFKDQFIHATTQQKGTAIEVDIAVSSSRQEESLAVVPWVPPSQLVPPTASEVEMSKTTEPSELTMEAEDSMEIEDSNENILQLGQSGDVYGGIGGMQSAGEDLPQWQQQHCMVPQPPHNTSTPITWFQ